MIPLKDIKKALLKDLYWAIKIKDHKIFGIKDSDINGTYIIRNNIREPKVRVITYKNNIGFEEFTFKYWHIKWDLYPAKIWYKGFKIHNLDGPAIEYDDGTVEWWFDGNRYDEDGNPFDYGERD